MNWSANVITSLSSDTQPTVSLVFDSAKYIFNVGENTTRAFLQSPFNWRKTRAIFLTGLSSDRSCGLPGFLMSLADGGCQKLNLVGPSGLHHLLASMRYYLNREGLELGTAEVIPEPESNMHFTVYQDDNITVHALAVLPRVPEDSPGATPPKRKRTSDDELPTSKRRKSSSPSRIPDSPKKGPLDIRKQIIKGMFGSSADKPRNFDRLPPWSPGDFGGVGRPAVSYIVWGPQTRGKFNAQKANALGLKSGPLRGKVAKGETVQVPVKLEDGTETLRTIRPEDCMDTPEKRMAVCILDCPSVDHISALVENPIWSDYHSGSDIHVNSIFHVLGENVIEDPRFVSWMKSFGDSVQHIVADRRYCPDPVTFTSAAHHQLRFNHLDSEMFPLPYHKLTPRSQLNEVKDLPKNTHVMTANFKVGIRPSIPPALDKEAHGVDLFHPFVNSDPTDPAFIPEPLALAMKNAKEAIAAAEPPGDTLPSGVEIIPLGSSSCTPTKYRNVSGTFIKIDEYGHVLFDCGEGSWGQLCRHFGTDSETSENVYTVLNNLRCIFISHIHADHHVGLVQVLSARAKLNPRPRSPLYLVAHRTVYTYLKERSDLEDLGIDSDEPGNVRLITCDAIHWERSEGGSPRRKHPSQHHESHINELKSSLGLSSFKTVDVLHRTRCSGAVLHHKDGWSMVFSGDTMPCDDLVKAGSGATLLIHEATLADSELAMAQLKAHSTVGQAIDVGQRMGAKNLLLTHFSARYPKLPPTTALLAQSEPAVSIAFDHAHPRMDTLWKMKYYSPVFEQSFEGVGES